MSQVFSAVQPDYANLVQYKTSEHIVQFYDETFSDIENRNRVKMYLDELAVFYDQMDKNDSSRNRIKNEIDRVSNWLK